MSNVKFVIFDMDGLMFDTEKKYADDMEKYLTQNGVKCDVDVLWEIVGTTAPLDMDRFNLSDLPHEEVDKMCHDAYLWSNEDMLTNGVPVKKGLFNLLDAIEAKGLGKCVATSTPIEVSGELLKKAGVYNRMNFVITGKEVAHGKPAPDIFLEACRRAGVKPEEALVLEDSINGGRAAKSGNIPYVIVPDVIYPSKDVEEGAFRICKDLDEVIDLL